MSAPIITSKGWLSRTEGHSVDLLVTVVDTTAYDVLMGTEFIAAVRGTYDIYTEKFTTAGREPMAGYAPTR